MTAFAMLDRLLGRRPVERFWSWRGKVAVRVSEADYLATLEGLAHVWSEPVNHYTGAEVRQAPYWGSK